MIKRSFFNRFLIIFSLLFVSIQASASTETPPDMLHYQVTGLDKIVNQGSHTLQISINPEDVLLKDGIGITIEFSSVNSLHIVNPKKLHFSAEQPRPYEFPLTVEIPDNDTSGVIITVTCKDFSMPYWHFFVTTGDTVEKFSTDPRELTKIHPADPRHPDNQRRIDTSGISYVPPAFIYDSTFDSIGLNPHDSNKKIRYFSQKLPESTGNPISEAEAARIRRDETPIPETEKPWGQSIIVGDSVFKRSWEDTVWRGEPLIIEQSSTQQSDQSDNVKIQKQNEQLIHFTLSLQTEEHYQQASKFFEKLERMDSTGYYHGWAPLKVAKELYEMQIPAKQYPKYPPRALSNDQSERGKKKLN